MNYPQARKVALEATRAATYSPGYAAHDHAAHCHRLAMRLAPDVRSRFEHFDAAADHISTAAYGSIVLVAEMGGFDVKAVQ